MTDELSLLLEWRDKDPSRRRVSYLVERYDDASGKTAFQQIPLGRGYVPALLELLDQNVEAGPPDAGTG